MDKPRFLSGYELVAKGLTKIEASLPEIGLKDINPNGSWLEQKQIQSALDARKQLIEVERIEKIGQLSQAVWRDDLQLAEVTKNMGPHWQFVGHNVGKHLYLRPEEALHLIESNCLLLKHNDVTVSLQKAYSLLLGRTTSLAQYKVYASLSRIGYRILQHNGPNIKKIDEKDKVNSVMDIEMKDRCNDSIDKVKNSDLNSNIAKDLKTIDDSDDKKIDEKEVNSGSDIEMIDSCNDSIDKVKDSELKSNIVKDLKTIDDSDDIVMKPVDNSENIDEKNIPIDNGKSMNVNEEVKEENGNDTRENVNGDKATEIIDSNADEKALGGSVSEVENVEMDKETKNHTLNSINKANFTIDQDGIIRILNKTSEEIELELSKTIQQNSKRTARKRAKIKSNRIQITNSYQQKLQKLKARKHKPIDHKVIEENFSSIPNIYRQTEVTINVPDEQLLPRNVFLNNTSYVINVDQVRNKVSRFSSTPDNETSLSVRRIRDTLIGSTPRGTDAPQFVNNTFRQEFPRVQFNAYTGWRPRQEFTRVQFSSFSTWRPRMHCNFYYPFNHMYIPRPSFSTLPSFFAHPRYRFQQASYTNSINQPSVSNVNNVRTNNTSRQPVSNNRGSIRSKLESPIKITALRTIQNLVERHKHLVHLTPSITTEPLTKLIGHYNLKYNERLRLTNEFELINDVQPVEVIELEDEETNKSKRRRLNEEGDAFDRNINAIKGLAFKLRELDVKKQCASRHRRALSNVIKKFNKSFNADIYINKDYAIIDRRFVTLDSSSDSEADKRNKKKRKLRNPFNILKRMKDKANNDAGTSRDHVEVIKTDNKIRETLLKHFDKNWIPNDDDFGRPEICTSNDTNSRIIDSREDELVYEFLKESRESCDNWAQLKTSFYENLEATTVAVKSQQLDIMSKDFMMDFDSRIKPILCSEDSTDMRIVLEKLRIIKTNKEVPDETKLKIDFDVYYRNVQNFRKTNLPSPHFRIICLDESSDFPDTAQIGYLQAQYDDNIPLVFAVIGFDSVSYLQIKPTDLDVYIPNDLG